MCLQCRLRLALEGCDTDAAVTAALERFAASNRPTMPTLTKLIARFGKSDAWHRGVALFNNLHILSREPDVEIANAALYACNRAAAPGAALKVYARMIECNVKADSISVKALLPVLAQNHWPEGVQVRPDSHRYYNPRFLLHE